jgi:hypothetical protein
MKKPSKIPNFSFALLQKVWGLILRRRVASRFTGTPLFCSSPDNEWSAGWSPAQDLSILPDAFQYSSFCNPGYFIGFNNTNALTGWEKFI